MNKFKKILLIVMTYGAILSLIYFLPPQHFLPYITFLITPVIVVAAIVHLIASIIDKRIFTRSIIVGIIFGFLGPLILLFRIRDSENPALALMFGFSLIPLMYSLFLAAGFILSCLVLMVKAKVFGKPPVD